MMNKNNSEYRRQQQIPVGHKKCATLFLTITPTFLDGFPQFVHQYKQEEILHREIQKLQHYHNCVSTLPEKKFKNTQNSMTMGDQSCLSFDPTSRAQPSQKVV